MRHTLMAFSIVLLAVATAPPPRNVSYNKKVAIKVSEVLRFPDFTLEYIGITHPGIPEVHMAPTHGYRVRRGTTVTIVHWSTHGVIAAIYGRWSKKRNNL